MTRRDKLRPGRKGQAQIQLLNANPALVRAESLIIAQAGLPESVTISTNMAGRGTDIILGGNAEGLAQLALMRLVLKRLLPGGCGCCCMRRCFGVYTHAGHVCVVSLQERHLLCGSIHRLWLSPSWMQTAPPDRVGTLLVLRCCSVVSLVTTYTRDNPESQHPRGPIALHWVRILPSQALWEVMWRSCVRQSPTTREPAVPQMDTPSLVPVVNRMHGHCQPL